jgi:hypothetical protein
MRRLHTADRRSRTATARLPGVVLARTLPTQKPSQCVSLAATQNNFAEHNH